MSDRTPLLLLLTFAVFLAFATPAAAFGAGNIASISKIEGENFRHGDIEVCCPGSDKHWAPGRGS